MGNLTNQGKALIPAPEAVRIELARASRQRRRLQALLRLSIQAAEDVRFLESLRDECSSEKEAPRD